MDDLRVDVFVDPEIPQLAPLARVTKLSELMRAPDERLFSDQSERKEREASLKGRASDDQMFANYGCCHG
jgi:hypothetical protein